MIYIVSRVRAFFFCPYSIRLFDCWSTCYCSHEKGTTLFVMERRERERGCNTIGCEWWVTNNLNLISVCFVVLPEKKNDAIFPTALKRMLLEDLPDFAENSGPPIFLGKTLVPSTGHGFMVPGWRRKSFQLPKPSREHPGAAGTAVMANETQNLDIFAKHRLE